MCYTDDMKMLLFLNYSDMTVGNYTHMHIIWTS